MAEYIEKEKIINKCKEHRDFYISAWESFIAMPADEKKICDAYAACWADVVNEPAADVQPVDRWISVKDKLPEEIGYYLVIIGNDMLYSIDIAEYSENRWHKHDRVIYWQNLPDYPKSINDDE